MKAPRKLTVEEAEALMPDGESVHFFREAEDGTVSARAPKSKFLELFRSNGVELSGDEARKANHGLATHDPERGWIFVETRREPK